MAALRAPHNRMQEVTTMVYPDRRYIEEERHSRRLCAAATRRDGPIRFGGLRCSSSAYLVIGTLSSSRLVRLAFGPVATELPLC